MILSYQVMKDTHDGLKWWARRGRAFIGLQQMLGYQTNARTNTNTTGVFAEWPLDYFFILPPMPVRTSWCLVKKQEQPNDREAVIMGVVGPGAYSVAGTTTSGPGPGRPRPPRGQHHRILAHRLSIT